MGILAMVYSRKWSSEVRVKLRAKTQIQLKMCGVNWGYIQLALPRSSHFTHQFAFTIQWGGRAALQPPFIFNGVYHFLSSVPCTNWWVQKWERPGNGTTYSSYDHAELNITFMHWCYYIMVYICCSHWSPKLELWFSGYTCWMIVTSH